MEAWITTAEWERCERTENALRAVAASYLPRPLRWTAQHPRLLDVAYKLRLSLKPTVFYALDPAMRGAGPITAYVQSKDGTVYLL
jgi:hypothetical protein